MIEYNLIFQFDLCCVLCTIYYVNKGKCVNCFQLGFQLILRSVAVSQSVSEPSHISRLVILPSVPPVLSLLVFLLQQLPYLSDGDIHRQARW